MCAISNYVNIQACHSSGRAPKPNKALRAFIAANLLLDGAFGIRTVTAASISTGVPRSSVKAAQIILQSGDSKLVSDVLNGYRPLLKAANRVRGQAKLIEDFRAATAEDRAAFGRAVGVATVFDTAIAPSL